MQRHEHLRRPGRVEAPAHVINHSRRTVHDSQLITLNFSMSIAFFCPFRSLLSGGNKNALSPLFLRHLRRILHHSITTPVAGWFSPSYVFACRLISRFAGFNFSWGGCTLQFSKIPVRSFFHHPRSFLFPSSPFVHFFFCDLLPGGDIFGFPLSLSPLG